MSSLTTSDYIPRRAAGLVREALADTRVVLVNGARQSGKSTVVRRVGQRTGAAWFTLDDPLTREAAVNDPVSFVRSAPRMIVDEIQRDPQLLLAMKALVDETPIPGRFLLTGSARVLGLRSLPDTLVGRMETIELWPLSQGEIDGSPDGFVDAAFSLGPDLRHESTLNRDEYLERLSRGGFPDAFARPERRRGAYLRNYAADRVNRDVTQLSEIERGPQMHALVEGLASRAGSPIAVAPLGASVGLNAETTGRYLQLLQEVYLIKHIPAWTRRISKRMVGQSKYAFVDSGVAAAIIGQNPARLRKPGAALGGLLEGFVAMEIARQLSWSYENARLSHYRTKDNVEVDLVLENDRGAVVGIEVKASATVRGEDFAGLRHLAERVGADFVAGYVLYAGTKTHRFGPRLRAVPIAALWESGTGTQGMDD
ncbi:MAG: ATP-binding protein [Frankiaceae bacterium]|jgi:predicted AAA+ superfamily ATPase|nr:ATP-binding protein [Frankiaceae bacterium]